MFSRRPNDRNRFDSKRVTQKVLEHKKDSATRLKHLKNFLDNTNEIEAQQFFKANYSLIFFLFYDFFIQVEAELKQRVNKAHKEELESAICIFEKILIFLPELIRRRWQFHCIGRLLSKLLHSQNALRTRKDGVRLFIMFYQIMGCGDEPAPNECHRMFAALVPQLASDLTPEQCPLSGGAFAVAFAGTRPPRSPNNSSGGGEHHHQCGGGGVNPVELSPMLSKTSAPESETPKDQTEDLLDHLLTCIVSETHKILWEQDCHRQHRDCFAYLFRSFQRYYIDALFPRLNRQFSIYDSRQLVIAEVDDWKRVLSEYGKFGEVRLLQGSLYPYQTVVLNWLTRFVIVHKEEAAGRNGKQQRDKDHTASNASAGSALTTSGGTGSAAGEASAGGSAASAAGSSGGGGGASSSIGGGSSGVGGSSGASATDSAGCCDQADAADAAAVHAAAVHAAAAGAMLPDEVPGSNASTLSSQNTNNSDPNDPGGAASAAAGGAASSSLQHRFTDTQIANVRDVLYSRRSSVNLVHELFRQAFLFPIEFHHTIRSVVAAYDSWLSAKGSKRPPFMMEPQLPNPALDPGIAQSASEHQMLPQPEEDARSSHTPPSESSPGRRSVRSDSYLTAVVDDESGGQAAAAPVEAGYHCIVQVFFSNSASVFFVPTREPQQRKDLLLVAQKMLQMLRHAVIHMQQAMARMANTTSHDALMQLYNLQQPTWNQLLNVLFTIASKLYSNPRSEDSVAAMIANNFLQTLFTTWLYALHYSNISDCMWDRLVEVLSKLTRWSPLIIEWNKTLEFCTKKLASDVYKLDLQNLPMDRLVSGPKRVKRKEKDRSRGGGGSSHGTPQRHQHSHGGGGGRLAGLEAAAAAAAAGPSGRHIGVADSFSLQKIEDNSSSIRKQLTEGSPSPSQLTASTAASTAPAAKATLLMTASGAAASAAAEKLLAASAASAAAPSASLSYSDSESISAASTAEFGFQQQQQQQPQQVTRSLGNTRETSLEPAGTPVSGGAGGIQGASSLSSETRPLIGESGGGGGGFNCGPSLSPQSPETASDSSSPSPRPPIGGVSQTPAPASANAALLPTHFESPEAPESSVGSGCPQPSPQMMDDEDDNFASAEDDDNIAEEFEYKPAPADSDTVSNQSANDEYVMLAKERLGRLQQHQQQMSSPSEHSQSALAEDIGGECSVGSGGRVVDVGVGGPEEPPISGPAVGDVAEAAAAATAVAVEEDLISSMDTKTAAALRLSREKLNSSSDAAAAAAVAAAVAAPLALAEEAPGSAPAGAATAAASAASMSGNATGAAAAGSASTGGASGHQSGSGSHTLSSALLWRRMIGCLGDVNSIEEPAILADVYTHLGNMLDKLLYLRLNQDFTYVRRSSQSDESDEAGGDQLDADDDEEDDEADGVGDSMVSTLTADAGGAVLTGAEDIPAADEDAIDFDDAAAASDPDDRADDADVETDDVADGATDSVRRRQRSRRSGGVRSSGSSASLPPLLVRPRRRPPRGAPAFIPPVAHIVPWLLAACRLPVSRFQEARLQALRLLCRATVRRHDNDVSPKHLAQFYWILHSVLSGCDQLAAVYEVMEHAGPAFFSAPLPCSHLLALDFIRAAEQICSVESISISDSATANRRVRCRVTAIAAVGSLLAFPVYFGDSALDYLDPGREEDSNRKPSPWPLRLCKCPGMADQVLRVLDSVISADPAEESRSLAMCSLALFAYQLLAARCSPEEEALNDQLYVLRVRECFAQLLRVVKPATTLQAKSARLAADLLAVLSNLAGQLATALPQIHVDVVKALGEAVRHSLTLFKPDPKSAMTPGTRYLLCSLVDCLISWCMVLPMPGLLDYHDSHPRGLVFEAMSVLSELEACWRAGSLDSTARLASLRAASAKQHLVNHLGQFPKGLAGATRLDCGVSEQHDLDFNLGDLSQEVLNQPNTQILAIDNRLLLSLVEITANPPSDSTGAGASAPLSSATLSRAILRSICGKFVWEFSLLYCPKGPGNAVDSLLGQLSPATVAKALPDYQLRPPLPFPTGPAFQSGSPAEAADGSWEGSAKEANELSTSMGIDDAGTEESETTDFLDRLLVHIGETSPECLLAPNVPLNVPADPKDPFVAAIEEEVSQQLAAQHRLDSAHIASTRDSLLSVPAQEAPAAVQEPMSPFYQCRHLVNQLGFLTWERREHLCLLDKTAQLARELKHLDSLPCRETHKLAVVYVAYGQEDKSSILSNCRGSEAFERFVGALGWEVSLANHAGFMGGFHASGKCGTTAPYYADSTSEIFFHVSTRMPTAGGAEDQLRKTKHLGNDEVMIVWSEHSRDYRRGTMPTEFGDVIIVVYPLPSGLYRIEIDKKAEVPFFGPLFTGAMVAEPVLASLVRATAIGASRAIRSIKKHFVNYYEERANYLESLVHRFQQRDETFEQFAKGVFAPVPAEFPAGGPFGSAVSHQHQQPGSLQLDHADCGGPRLKDELLHVSVQPASDEAATLQQQLQQPHADELQSPQGKSGKAGGDFDLSVAQRLRMSSRRAAKSMRRSVPPSMPSSVSGSLAAGLSNLGPPRSPRQ